MTSAVIREFDPGKDLPAIHALMSVLQEVERAWDSALPPGEVIADDYLAWIFSNCSECDGKVFVAELGGAVVGFVTALAHVMPDEPDEPPIPFAYVSELVVDQSNRRAGVGEALLARAEDYVKSRGGRRVRTKALCGNGDARRFYAFHGYADREIELEKVFD